MAFGSCFTAQPPNMPINMRIHTMAKEKLQKDIEMLNERFGKDTLLSLATIDGDKPTVRIVGLCSIDYFSAHGIATNLGHIYSDKNLELTRKRFLILDFNKKTGSGP